MSFRRFMRGFLMGVALSLVIAGNVAAQPQTAPSQRRAETARGQMIFHRIEQATEQLGLSEQQKAQVRQILDDARAEARELMQQAQQLEPHERRQRMRDLTMRVHEQIMGVLNEDQKSELRELLAEMRNRETNLRRDAQPPGTQPVAERIGAMVDRLRDAVQQLQLSDEQKAKAEQILQEMRTKLRMLRDEAAGDLEQIREKGREIFNSAREDLQELLTTEQRQKLRELMENLRTRATRPDEPDRRSQPGRAAPPPPTAPDEQNMDQPASPAPDAPRAAIPPPSTLKPGQPAPDFALRRLDGRPVQLSFFQGRVLVLLFGNYSSPSFRHNIANLEQLRKETGYRAEFLLIYTRESHPAGEWEVERNKNSGISLEQPKSFDERKKMAQQARLALKITMPMAIDSMDDRTATDYGGFTNAAVVIGRDGRIVGHLKWSDAAALRRLVEEAILSRPTTRATES